MKRLSIATVGFLFTLISCQKEDIINQESDAAEDVNTFLKMSASSMDSTTCHADSVSDPLHRRRHTHREITEIDLTTIRIEITNYIATNYAGSTIERAGVDSLGFYYIKIMKADGSYIGLLFDANGNFVKELTRGHRGTIIDTSALPTVVIAYIRSNYTGASVHKAILENDNSYKVILTLADGTFVGLAFDANGNFVTSITVRDNHGRKKRRR